MIDIEIVESSIEELENGNLSYEVCKNLAALYAVRDEYYKQRRTDNSNSGSEFMRTVSGMKVQDVLSIMDQVMDAVKVMNIRTYQVTIQELNKMKGSP